MKAIKSILSLIFLSGSIAAEAGIDSGIETKKTKTNRNLRTPEIILSNSSQETTRGTQENCGITIELELYDKQVSDIETTSFFGPSGRRDVNGPIAALFCKGGKHCPKLKLQAYTPDLPIGEGDQTVTTNSGWRWTPYLSLGKVTCGNGEIVTGVECKGQNCGSVRLKCSPLNSEVYQRSISSKPSTSWTTNSSTGRRSRCAKGSYMVGMECRGHACSEIRLDCAKIEYKDKKLDCTGGGNGGTVDPPAPTCKDKTLSNGQPWSDGDGNDCNRYSKWSWCSKYGNLYTNVGYGEVYTANEACCECGGGDRKQ